jgi:hypothetical protein
MGIANGKYRKSYASNHHSYPSTRSGSHSDSNFRRSALSLLLELEWSVRVPDADGYVLLENAICPACGNTKAEDHKPDCKLRKLLDER